MNKKLFLEGLNPLRRWRIGLSLGAMFRIVNSWFCLHSVCILRWNDEGKMWTWCLGCGHESEGVQMRGPEVA